MTGRRRVVVGLGSATLALLLDLGGARVVAQQRAEDSLVPAAVYVPAACAAASGRAPVPRCPLVVFPQVPDTIARTARAMVEWQRVLAEKYQMILLVPSSIAFSAASRDSLLQQTLRTYAVDTQRIALVGYRVGGCAEPGVFRRVALLSPMGGFIAPVCATDGGRPSTVQIYLEGGLGEPLFVSSVVHSAPQLRQAGHRLEGVLALRGYEAGPTDFERAWRWIRASWATAAPGAGVAAPVAGAGRALTGDDPGPLLTARALARLTTFWRRFQQEPDSVRITARLAHQQLIIVPVRGERFTLQMMDTPAVAAQYSTVAADLKAVGLSARQADVYRRAFIVAAANTPAPRRFVPKLAPVAATSRLGRNMAFMSTHKEALKVLGATGMWLTP